MVNYDKSADIYSTDIGIRIDDEEGNFIGVTKAVLNIEEAIGIIKELEQSGTLKEHSTMQHQTMHFNLINKDGKIIYSTYEFTFFEDAPDELLMPLMLEEPYHYAISRPHGQYEREELLAHAASLGYKDYQGLGWVLVLGLETEEIFAPIYELRNLILFISTIVIMFSIVVGIFISRSFSKPIIKLRDMVKDVSKGNLNAKIETTSNDEVGELTVAFKQMTENLKKSRGEIENYSKTLEKQVEERTKELDDKVIKLQKSETATLSIMEDLHETLKKFQKSQKKIELQNIKLKKLDKIKSDFLNVTSHELRTPMSAIKGYIQMILKQTLGNVTDEQKKALNTVLRNTNRLDNLIQDILDISRLESGTMKFIPEPTDLRKMIDETVETMQSSADLKEIKISTDFDSPLPELIIDHERMEQVIINIVNNAIKFSPDGSIVNVRARKEKDDVLFEIEDFGKGIPEENQKKVFDTFYQVDSGMDRKFGGAGLGLAICRGIVLSHGGKIWVESAVGKGSIFKFKLPIQSVKDLESRFREIDIFGLQMNEKDTKNIE